MAVVLTVAMCAQSMSVYASDAITDSGEEIFEEASENRKVEEQGGDLELEENLTDDSVEEIENEGEINTQENNWTDEDNEEELLESGINDAPIAYASEQFTYEELNGSYISITGYIGTEKNLEIPGSIDGFVVQKIADGAFQNENIESIKFPDSLESIGNNAFKQCAALNTVKFNNVKNICGSAFEGCTSLKGLEFPGSLTEIGTWSFNNCTGLTSVTLPDSVTSIGRNAFAGCTNLESINYPMGLTSAGESIFEGDSKLKRVTVPEGVEKLPGNVFKNCGNFTEIILPESLKEIGGSSLEGCTGLTEISLPSGLTAIGSWGLCNCTGLTHVTLPEGVASLGRNAFAECKNLESINYPENLSNAGESIFAGDIKLKRITVPEGVEKLPGDVFKNCGNFTEIILPESLKEIGGGSLEGCTGLKTISLPSGLTTIGSWGFNKCTGLKNVQLPDTVETLGRYSFADCTSLDSINYPKSLSSAGEGIFSGDSKLKSITVPEGIEKLPDNVFKGCTGFTKINLPSTLTIVGASAFEGIGLERLVLPDKVTAIGAYAFCNCGKLEHIWIGENVKNIHDRSFEGCNKDKLVIHGKEGSYAQQWSTEKGYKFVTDPVGQTDLILKGKVTEQGVGVSGIRVDVYNCNRAKIIYTDYTDENGEWSYGEAEAGNRYRIRYSNARYKFEKNDIEITVNENSEIPEVKVTVVSGIPDENAGTDFTYALINANLVKITGYQGNGDTVVIPAEIDGHEVQSLGNNVFRGNNGIRMVVLPEGMEEIGAEAFKNCTQLSSVLFSTTIRKIGGSAFEGCTSLKGLEFPGSLTEIGTWSFNNCTGLTSVTLPDSVTSIGRNAFAGCTNLESINYPMGLTSAGESIFEGDSKLKRVTVPEGVEKLPGNVFKNCGNFTEIILPESLKEIGGSSLEGCTGLTEISLPSGLTAIGSWGLCNCTGLTHVTLPEGVASLGRNAFAECKNLESINYPENLSNAGESIFAGDIKLKRITVPEGVEKLPGDVFKNCGNFTEIILPESLKEIGGGSLEGCTGLKTISLPSGLTTIGSWGFNKCTGLKNVQLPDTVETLGRYSFADCTSLDSINYPKSLSSAGEGIFSGDSKLKSITVPEGIEKLPDNVFKGCSKIRYVNLPSTLISVGASSFEGCSGIPSITIPENVKSIGNYAFYGCSGLVIMTIPDKIKGLGKNVFGNCINLSQIYISDSVINIEDNTFEGDSKVVFYCNYNSYATIYAINKGISFVSTGGYKENKESVLDKNNTSYYGDFNGISSNGYIAMTVKYKIQDNQKTSVSALTAEIILPSNAEFDESTLKVDGVLCTEYNYDGGRMLRIPLTDMEGVIRYSIKAKKQSDTTSYATMYYSKNSEQTKEIIGVINESINIFTINTPEIVSDDAFDVSGVAPASSKIVLKINGENSKEIKTSKAGIWACKLQLKNPVDYQEYKIEAVCSQNSETRSSKVTYHKGEPTLSAFKMLYNEHQQIKTCNLLNTNGITPSVYYVPGTKFDFELSFKNADQIKEIYVTSTRNNETKYLKATYNKQKKAFVTNGYFDENNHNYIPGTISYEYSRPAPEVIVGQEVDWEKMLKNLPEGMLKNLTVIKNTDSDYKATIDLAALGKEFADVGIDATISVFDENTGSNMGVWKDILEENGTILSYILPGYDGKQYICNLDYSDASTWYMLVKDVTGSKYIGFVLDTAMENEENLDRYWNLSQISSTLSTINKSASMLYENYQIEKDMDQLRKDVMSSGNYSSAEELNKALKSVDELENDQKLFMIITTVLPLIVGSSVAVGASMSAAPLILFTALLGAMTASSSFFWSIRKANIKGEKYRSKFIVDPSGYVYDQTTGKRLENVTVTAYCIEYDESENFWNIIPSSTQYGKKWDALEYNQQNPLYTNSDGKYAWDVPEGWWRVKYEKKGYKTTWSDWMTVPPLQTEVNIGMVPDGAVEAEHKWDKGTVTIKPTCTATGIIRYECQDCHQTKTEVLPIDSKNHEKTTNVVTKATVKKNGSVTKKCTACKKVVSKSIIYYPKTVKLTRTGLVYSGKVQKPRVVIRDAKNKIISSSLYTLKYSAGCKNVGRYTVRVTFKGNYSGAVSLYYQILPKGTVISAATSRSGGFTVRWKKQAVQTSGYQIQYAENSSFRGARTITISKNSTTVRNILKLKKNKKYYVRIRTYRKEKGKNYYSSWSKTKAVTTKK